MANKNEIIPQGGGEQDEKNKELIKKLELVLEALKESPAVKAFEQFIKLSSEESRELREQGVGDLFEDMVNHPDVKLYTAVNQHHSLKLYQKKEKE